VSGSGPPSGRSGVSLLTVRHAPVDAQGVCYGQRDVPTLVSAEEVAARLLPDVVRFGPATVWSSDALRCFEPAGLLAHRLEVEHRVDLRIRELTYGAWEGRLWSEIPPAELDEWNVDWLTRSPPGGETVLELASRVRNWWEALPAGSHFLLAHAGVVHCLDVLADGLAWEETLHLRLDYLEARHFRREVAV